MGPTCLQGKPCLGVQGPVLGNGLSVGPWRDMCAGFTCQHDLLGEVGRELDFGLWCHVPEARLVSPGQAWAQT